MEKRQGPWNLGLRGASAHDSKGKRERHVRQGGNARHPERPQDRRRRTLELARPQLQRNPYTLGWAA